jgi:hypothetical protein
MNKITLVSLLLMTSFCLSAQETDWTFRNEENGIKAYTRKHDWSKFDEYRVEMTLKSEISNVLALFKDFDVYPELFPGTATVINHENEVDHYVNYIVVKTPFPAKNRDGVYINQLAYDAAKKNLHIDVSCTNDYYEKSSKNIQIENCKGFWDIKDIGNGQLNIVQQFVMDPGGVVPAFIINMQTVKNPMMTFEAIKKMANLPKYQNRKFEILNN